MTSTGALLRHRAAGGHLVREARPLLDRHAPVRARLQPGDRARRGRRAATTTRSSRWPRVFSAMARAHLGVRRDLVATPLLHDTPDETGQPGGRVARLARGECEPVPGRTMPKLTVVERDYGAIAREMAALGPMIDALGTRSRASPHARPRDRAAPGACAGRCAAARRRPPVAGPGRARLRGDPGPLRAPPTAASPAGLRRLERADRAAARGPRRGPGRAPDHVRRHSGPARSRSSPRRSGPAASTAGGATRRSRSTSSGCKPWHTLTGRQHFFLDHDWMAELGEQLPIYRPPLDMHAHVRRPAGRGRRRRPEVTVRYLTPHSKWSIHSEYQDNLFMLSLSRGGPTIWMSPEDAARIGVRGQRLDRGGTTATAWWWRAPSSATGCPRAPCTCTTRRTAPSTCRSPRPSGQRGGIHNSLTRLLIKPTHLIGGYAQLSYGFNYYGPTGNQRDEVTVIRRRSQDVEY